MEFFETVKGLLYVAGLYAMVPVWGSIVNVLAIGVGVMRIFEIIGGLF